MAAFSELIKNFDKIRDYMRDFYIYGFKSRSEFDKKSTRSYDNEKRRIESYLDQYIKWNYDQNGKRTFVSLNSAHISENPLYSAWKAKSFTDSDVMLHFALLDVLHDGCKKSVSELTDEVSLLLNHTFDVQTVRGKCREYEKEGILCFVKQGKSLLYYLSQDKLALELFDAVPFFAEAFPFGEIGSFLMDDADLKNDAFRFKHHFIIHSLEDSILLEIFEAMKEKCWIEITNFSDRNKSASVAKGVPLKILSSVVTGRRYVVLHLSEDRGFATYRLDYIKSLVKLEKFEDYDETYALLEARLRNVWGVSLGGYELETVKMKLYIDEENEGYVLQRLHREGRGGEITRVEDNTFLYSIELYDSGEIATWIKTFMGRILSLEGSDPKVIDRFDEDMERMKTMYLQKGEN